MSKQLGLWGEHLVKHNIFFATRPDATAVARIASLARDIVRSRRLKAKLLSPGNLHVSLLSVGEFAGAYPPSTIADAKTAAADLSMAPFTVMFDRVASFGRRGGHRPLVLTGGDGVVGLVRLQQALSLAMAKVGVGAGQKDQFTPHVTMMYGDEVDEFSIEPISWRVEEFVLIDSLQGQSKHVPLGQWPLPAPSHA